MIIRHPHPVGPYCCEHRPVWAALMADEGVERGSAGVSRSTRRDVTWLNAAIVSRALHTTGKVSLARDLIASQITVGSLRHCRGFTRRQPVT
jgi:hypothetical protein